MVTGTASARSLPFGVLAIPAGRRRPFVPDRFDCPPRLSGQDLPGLAADFRASLEQGGHGGAWLKQTSRQAKRSRSARKATNLAGTNIENGAVLVS